MDLRAAGDPTIVVSTADPELLDHALSVVAAAGLEAEVTSDPAFSAPAGEVQPCC